MIVIDIETTGTNPNKHAILSIGAINFKKTKNQFYGECRISKDVSIDNKALKINGFLKKDILSKQKQSLKSLLMEFSKWIDKQNTDNIMMGHNIHFDYEFLKVAYFKNKLTFPFTYRLVDLHSIAFYKSLKNNNLENIDFLSLNKILQSISLPKDKTPHNALERAKMEIEAFYKLIYNKSAF